MLQDKILNILENRNGALYKEAEKLKIEGYPEEGYLQLAVIRQLCIEEQYRQARKETKTKANPLAAIKKLTSMTSPHLVDLFRKVMPEAADKTDFSWCTDTHMLIFDKAEHMQGLSKGFYYHRELGTIPGNIWGLINSCFIVMEMGILVLLKKMRQLLSLHQFLRNHSLVGQLI